MAVFEERWVAEVEKALATAEKAEKHHVHAAQQLHASSEIGDSDS